MNIKPIKSTGYDICFGDASEHLINFMNGKNYSKIFFFVDSNTSEYCYPIICKSIANIFPHDVIEINAGEENKDIDICIGIWKMLLDFGADRNSLMINLGGGVVTDMGSFVAATYKRGIDFLQIPTSLLSQVDASVGGKTGIDIGGVKNMVGTFSLPKTVIIDPVFLNTLPDLELVSGLAEIIKHGLIYDKTYFDQIKSRDLHDISIDLIHRSVEIKNDIVTKDLLEKADRKKLNFGHTIGHAVETYSLQHDKNPLTHGQAIAIGMICESWLSKHKTGLSETELSDIVGYILGTYSAYPLKEEYFEDMIKLMKHDKKNDRGLINFTLLTKIGSSSINHYCLEEEIRKALLYYAENVSNRE